MVIFLFMPSGFESFFFVLFLAGVQFTFSLQANDSTLVYVFTCGTHKLLFRHVERKAEFLKLAEQT